MPPHILLGAPHRFVEVLLPLVNHHSTASAIIRRGTSPIPIGLTPGFLFKGISRQATKAVRLLGCKLTVQRRLATAARALHKSVDAP